MNSFLSQEEVLSLKSAHRSLREKRLADRIKAILYLNYGYTYSEIKKLLLLDESTITRCVKRFKGKGVDGLLELHFSGGKTKLTKIELGELKNHIIENEYIYLTASHLKRYVNVKYHIHYSLSGITKLLHTMGFVYKKPKLNPGKADIEKQKRFLTEFERIKSNLGESDQIYFLDATHPTHNTRASFGWILKGTTRFLKSNTGRERININGALNAINHEVVVRDDETINANSTVNLIKQIEVKHRSGLIYLILDNAKYNYSRKVRAYCMDHPRFILKYLPSYSPNLNLIERLWRLMHKCVTYNKYYETFTEFKEACLGFFRNIKYHEKELRSLLTHNFEILPT